MSSYPIQFAVIPVMSNQYGVKEKPSFCSQRDLDDEKEFHGPTAVVLELPTHWEICGECRGEGKSSAHLGCFTASEFHEQFSPDEAEDYFRGAYDRQCDECGGTGKVREVDMDRLDPEVRTAYEKRMDEEAQYESECAAEIRMGA